MAIVNQPLPTSPLVWRDDPASFDDFPEFFIAHEIAHQWWGQAVGWKNYHEQWLSEGFSQYFAALYAEMSRGPGVFATILRQLARWTISHSDQGPIYLGYRLGHLKGDGRIFRALVYNKGAAILHMLRRMLGDEVFFAGLRQYYLEFRYTKAGAEDLRKALELASGRSLEPFFNFWVYGQDVPSLDVKWKVASEEARVRIDLAQRADSVGEFPVTLTRVYANGSVDEETVIVSSETMTLDRPITGRLRSIEINRDRFTPLRR
jgi:aminopeptidase N